MADGTKQPTRCHRAIPIHLTAAAHSGPVKFSGLRQGRIRAATLGFWPFQAPGALVEGAGQFSFCEVRVAVECECLPGRAFYFDAGHIRLRALDGLCHVKKTSYILITADNLF